MLTCKIPYGILYFYCHFRRKDIHIFPLQQHILSFAQISIVFHRCYIWILLVLIDAPYPHDGVWTCCEKPVECWNQLQGIDSILMVLLHFIWNNVGNHWSREKAPIQKKAGSYHMQNPPQKPTGLPTLCPLTPVLPATSTLAPTSPLPPTPGKLPETSTLLGQSTMEKEKGRGGQVGRKWAYPHLQAQAHEKAGDQQARALNPGVLRLGPGEPRWLPSLDF